VDKQVRGPNVQEGAYVKRLTFRILNAGRDAASNRLAKVAARARRVKRRPATG
jgi:hypothetical protein